MQKPISISQVLVDPELDLEAVPGVVAQPQLVILVPFDHGVVVPLAGRIGVFEVGEGRFGANKGCCPGAYLWSTC